MADADGTPADAALRLGAEAAACQGSQGCAWMQIGGLGAARVCKHTGPGRAEGGLAASRGFVQAFPRSLRG